VPISIPDQEEAKRWAESSPEIKIFVNASYQKGKAGIGMFHSPYNNYSEAGFRILKRIGHYEGLTATYIETLAIKEAIEFVDQRWPRSIIAQFSDLAKSLTYVVVSDSQAAIQQIRNPRNHSSQAIVQDIYRTMHNLEANRGPGVRLQWVPAHAMVIGDEIADELAKQVTEGTLNEIKHLTTAAALSKTKEALRNETSTSKYTLDSALPGNHTQSLYDNRLYKEAAVLYQLRTGKSRLHNYLAKIQEVKSSQCEYTSNTNKTVRHFLFECPQWCQHRGELRKVAGSH
jgi:ribonuclease HI